MINLSSLEELLPEESSPNETSVTRGTYHSFVSATAMHYVIPDGATVPVPVADSLVDAASLKAGDRVVMMRQRQRQFILGKSGGAGGGDSVAAGSILAWTSGVIPGGWLLCNGQEVSRTTYADLFAIIGTAYGAGNGTTTFNVPDLRGRTVVGLNATDPEFDALGKKFGTKTHTLTGAEIPTMNVKGSQHASGTMLAVIQTLSGDHGGYPNRGVLATAGAEYNVLQVPGGGGAHNNIQPSFTANWIIKGMGGIGSLTPTVEAALVNRIAVLEADREFQSDWTRVVPIEAGPNQTIDPITGIVTTSQPSSVNQMNIRVPFEDGYEYKFELYLNVYSGHAADNSIWFRMSKNNVISTGGGYQTAGYWSQHSSTWGVYASNSGIGGAIGMVSGSNAYNPFRTTLILRQQAGVGRKWFWFEFDAITQGSARGTSGNGYTPGHPGGEDWDGINLYCGGTVGRFYGEYHVFKRRVR